MNTELDIIRPALLRPLAHFAQGDELAKFGSEQKRYGEHIVDVDEQHPANCILSGKRTGDWSEPHLPMLDIDAIPWRIVPSRTSGHAHIYIDKAITWGDYCRLLKLLAELDLIDRGWAEHSVLQGAATLRLPL